MTYLVIALIIASWLLCSVIAYAGTFAYYQGFYVAYPEFNKDQEEINKGFCAIVGLLGGPIALLVSFFYTGGYKYGLRFW